MTTAQRNKFIEQAAIAAMRGIVSNPVAWTELRVEAKATGMTQIDGLAAASVNMAEALADELNRRSKPARKGTSEKDGG